MKTFKRFLAICALSCLVAIPALAGDQHTPGVTDPPPPPESTMPGDQHTPGMTSASTDTETSEIDPVLEIALTLFGSLF